MSNSAPSCTCRLPWIVTAIALGVLIAERVVASFPSTTPVASSPTSIPTTAQASDTDTRLASLQHDLDEVRRVLDIAQSALAERDREISTANAELQSLRLELDTLRAKTGSQPPAP